jgi:hypothetical protein
MTDKHACLRSRVSYLSPWHIWSHGKAAHQIGAKCEPLSLTL